MTDVASNDTLCNHAAASFTQPMRISLFYAARCKAGLTCWRHEKYRILVGL